MTNEIVITDELIAQTVSSAKRYFVVLSKAGPKRDQSPEETDRIQQEHIRHNLALRASGVLLVHGPVTDDDDLRGIAIYAANDKEEVEQLVKQNPAVIAGRLVYEIHSWYGFAGDCLR